MTEIHVDFESRSTVDLKEAGLDNYARHPSTDVWCMAYSVGDEPVEIIRRGELKWGAHPRFAQAFTDGSIVIAHNATFELAIWNNIMVPRYGWPALKVEQTRCTMAMAYAMSLPGALDNAAAAVGIPHRKDGSGYRLMLMMCRPREIKPDGKVIWWDDPDKMRALYDYCMQDVRVERELSKRLFPLSPDEQALWVLDQKINQRGIYVDREAAQAAIEVVQAEQDRLNLDMRAATDNFVGFCTENARITKWVQQQGVDVSGVAKADIAEALADVDVPPHVKRVLEIRKEAGKSSTSKLRTMMAAASEDGRLRGMLQYHGAGTGRWAGRKVQLHNLPRPEIEQHEIEAALARIIGTGTPAEKAAAFDLLYGSPLSVVSSCLRGMLCAAPGNELLAADFANIEGRGLAWLAGEDWKLQAFRDYDAGTGPDLYLVAAAKMYRKPIDQCKPHRPVGKVVELAGGFGGGLGAIRNMERALGVDLGMTDEEVEAAKSQWRESNPKIVRYWGDLEGAAVGAVRDPGQIYAAGARGRETRYRVKGSFLWCLLPSKRVLCYPYPQIREVDTPWGEKKEAVTYMTVLDPTARKKSGKLIEDPQAQGNWQRVSTYSGKLAENVTQAICRDLLASAIIRVEAAGYPVVLHVHDEVVSEVPAGTGDLKAFEDLCAQLPAWAVGLPVTANGWRSRRYKK